MWSATLAARSASPGAGGVFICASPVKAFDTDENRVLVAALAKVRQAARLAENPVPGPFNPPAYDLRRARVNGERARRALEHRSLQSVSHTPINGRMLTKARTGTKAPRFKAAVALLQRSWRPVTPEDLAPFVDPRTAEEHGLAADVVDLLHSRGELVEPLRIIEGWVRGGRFAYAHPGRDGADRRAGVLVDDRQVTSVAQV
jgi:hypothetical protein